MDATTRFDSVTVGALPVLSAMMDQWGLGKIIDGCVPWDGDIPLGTLVEVLVINRLQKPEAMYAIGEWAAEAGVADFYGLTADQLHDDRLGMALERLAQHSETAQTQLTLAAVKHWRLNVDEIHYDISNVEFFGAYADAEPSAGKDTGKGPSPQEMPTTPCPMYGHTKSGRDDMKQIQFGMNVTADGGVPLSHQPLDGNAAEARTHVANLRRLGKLFPKSRFLYTADTKLDTPENLVAAVATGGQFLCAGAFTQPLQDRCRKLRQQMRPIEYCPKSHANRPVEQRDQYQACEVAEELTGEFQGLSIRHPYRLLFVHSSAKAKQKAETRERHVQKIRIEFELVQRNLGKYSFKTETAIRRRLEKACVKYTEGKFFHYTLTGKKGGQFLLQWHIDEVEQARCQELEGVFVLKTNLPKKDWSITEVLSKYRDQSKIEKRFHHLKGPLAVAPMFLKNPKRIAGMLFIVVMALTLLSLMERQVRKSLKGKPMKGLYPEGRLTKAPTGPRLLRKFRSLTVVIIKERGEAHRRLCELKPIQREILRLLNLTPNDLRTFKRRCLNWPPENTPTGCGT
jgi:transposase